MIILLLALLACAALFQNWSLSYFLRDVEYSVSTDKSIIEPDEEFSLSAFLSNKKWVPVPFVKIVQLIPSQLSINKHKSTYLRDGDLRRLQSSTYLLPYQKYSMQYQVSLPCRGRYFMRGAVLSAGDIFGIKETVEHIDLAYELVVMPRVIDLGPQDRVVGGFIGDISVNRFIMEDPILTLGFREYTGREPMKQINWQQSLKAGQLMVKSFDHTQELSIRIVLNVECGADGRSPSPQLIEWCFSATRYVCQYLEGKRIKYSLVTNATAAGAIGHWSSVADGLGGRHLSTILEGLGRATYDSTERFSSVLGRVCQNRNVSHGYIIITPSAEGYWSAEYKQLLKVSDGHCITLSADKSIVETPEQEVA